MRETKFIQQNKNKWKEFEKILRLPKKDPDELSELFVEITNDLSYSRTFYPFRSVRVYLNNLAQTIFLSIYKKKRGRGKNLIRFWKFELPLIAYQNRRELLISFLVFMLAVVIGVVSSINDPEFPKIILGDDYIAMTETNIEGGDPMAVYKKMREVDMFLGITLNNLRVVFLTFILGILLAIGSLFIMLYNGIMLGVFQYFFIERDLFWESFLTIWIHGTLEISAIIIAGASGLILGRGLVFPGTLSRLQSFQISAIRGLKLLLGIAPIIVSAAILESYVTRYTELPDYARGLIIFLSLFFILYYFVYYPWKKFRGGEDSFEESIELAPSRNQPLPLKDQIFSNSMIFMNIFIFYRKYLRKILKINLILVIVYLTISSIILYDPINQDVYLYGIMFWKISYLFDVQSYPVMIFLNTLLLSSAIMVTHVSLKNEVDGPMPKKEMSKYLRPRFIWVFFISLIFMLILYLPGILMGIFYLILLPLLLFISFVILYEESSPLSGFRKARLLMANKLGKLSGLYILLLVLSLFLFLFIDTPFINNYLEIFLINFSSDTAYQSFSLKIIKTFISLCGLMFVLPILISGMGILYFSLKEIEEANGLKNRIQNLSVTKKKNVLNI